MKRFFVVVAICMLIDLASAGTNACKQFTTCRTCLNITEGHTEGHREGCGWCHFAIQYLNGSAGVRCADINDDPWTCPDLFDTYKCNAGFKCVDEVKGTCAQTTAGDGYGSNSTCQQYCTPHPVVPMWRCNTTSYVCEKCTDDSAKGCDPNRGTACGECSPPAGLQYKCNRTDKDHPTCDKCKHGDGGCSGYNTACRSCAAPAQLYSCDNKTFTCKKDATGFTNASCGMNCGHFTPINLLGYWRGLMVKNHANGNFEMGEYDMHFGNTNLTLTYPNKTQ